jgi:Predicted periplasmic lipoprotein (DUF2279)
MTRRLSILALLLLLLAPRPAVGQESSTAPFRLASAADLALVGPEEPQPPEPCAGFSLFLAGERPAGCPRVAAADDAVTEPSPGGEPVTPPRETWLNQAPWLKRALPYMIPIGVTAAGVATALPDGRLRPFRFTDEGWFGAGTYAGGADKAAHFVNYTILSRELIYLYKDLGYSDRASILLGSGMGLLEGLANEFADGFNRYGFSPQDAAMDIFGAGLSVVLVATRTDDLVGFRSGFLLPRSDVTCCAVPGKGEDYSNHIYTADLKLAGAERRLGRNIGPLRYLMFSVTYGSKFYPSGPPDLRERQVGFEIGLNFEEILNSLGVRRDKWWGYGLHIFFDNIRVPFTAVGFQYGLNRGRWYGPGNGNQYSTSP